MPLDLALFEQHPERATPDDIREMARQLQLAYRLAALPPADGADAGSEIGEIRSIPRDG
ncbi:MAG: hypothetical protein ACRYG5_17375 [Janthinobacterium lividum]